MKLRSHILALALLGLVCTGAVGGSLRVPGDAPTIAGALALVDPGDTVSIAPGTYIETDLMLTDGIVLRGDIDNPGLVVLDAFYGGRIMECVDFQNPTTIEGITFTRGVSGTAAAFFCDSSEDVTIRHCIFADNLSGDDGGAMICNDSNVLIEDCRFVNNSSNFGSGGAVTSRRSNTVLRRCTFTDNSAFAYGGAFYYSAITQSPVLEKCIFEGNMGGLGGAFAANGWTAELSDCSFAFNEARNQGGAFYVGFGSDVLFADSRFNANAAPEGKLGIVGGGSRAELHCCEADPTLITGGGQIVWSEEGCEQVDSETLSFGRLKARFR